MSTALQSMRRPQVRPRVKAIHYLPMQHGALGVVTNLKVTLNDDGLWAIGSLTPDYKQAGDSRETTDQGIQVVQYFSEVMIQMTRTPLRLA